MSKSSVYIISSEARSFARGFANRGCVLSRLGSRSIFCGSPYFAYCGRTRYRMVSGGFLYFVRSSSEKSCNNPGSLLGTRVHGKVTSRILRSSASATRHSESLARGGNAKARAAGNGGRARAVSRAVGKTAPADEPRRKKKKQKVTAWKRQFPPPDRGSSELGMQFSLVHRSGRGRGREGTLATPPRPSVNCRGERR